MRIRLLLLAACAAACVAADWPQWRGPDRSGVSAETGLLQQWPKDGPELAWTFENAGTGYGSFAVVGGRAYVLGARPLDAVGDKRVEQLIALDDKGKERWKADIGPMWDFDGNQWSGGPNSTPTVDGDRVFALGSQGDAGLRQDGRRRRGLAQGPGRRNSAPRFRPAASGRRSAAGASRGRRWWTATSSICTPGGPKGLFVAFDKATGNVLWRSAGLADACTYSSPIVAEIGGVRQYIALVQSGIVGVAAKDGSTLWQYRREVAFPDIVASDAGRQGQPHLHQRLEGRRRAGQCDGGRRQVQGGVGIRQKEIASPHGGVVLVDKCLYGNHDLRTWECLDFETGIVRWKSDRAARTGSVVYAEGRLYVLTADGVAALLAASPDGYKELGRFPLPKQFGASQAGRQGVGASGDQRRQALPARSGIGLLLQDREMSDVTAGQTEPRRTRPTGRASA